MNPIKNSTKSNEKITNINQIGEAPTTPSNEINHTRPETKEGHDEVSQYFK